MNIKQVRYLHQMLDRLAEGKNLSPEEIKLLRKELPELPKQKTLEEIAWDMDFAWAETSGNDWKEELFGDLETWLSEQHSQLRAHLEGVKSQSHPALPAGMRIAEHENFGRVIVSPGIGIDGCHEIFYLDPGMASGTDISEVEPESLTFIDANAPDAQVVRTLEELEALDPDTAVISAENGASYYVKNLTERHTKTFLYVPAVVIATGEQVRAAREAMVKENE